MIRERGGALVRGSFFRSVARLRDIQAWLVFVQMLNVADLRSAIDRDGGRQALVEKLALIVADNDHGVRIHLLEFPPERFHRGAAALVTFAPRLDIDLGGEAGRTSVQQRFVIVGFSAKPVSLVLPVGLGAKVPLLGGSGEQGAVRASDA